MRRGSVGRKTRLPRENRRACAIRCWCGRLPPYVCRARTSRAVGGPELLRRFNHCAAPVPEALAVVVPENVKHSSVLVLTDQILSSSHWCRGRNPPLKTLPASEKPGWAQRASSKPTAQKTSDRSERHTSPASPSGVTGRAVSVGGLECPAIASSALHATRYELTQQKSQNVPAGPLPFRVGRLSLALHTLQRFKLGSRAAVGHRLDCVHTSGDCLAETSLFNVATLLREQRTKKTDHFDTIQCQCGCGNGGIGWL